MNHRLSTASSSSRLPSTNAKTLSPLSGLMARSTPSKSCVLRAARPVTFTSVLASASATAPKGVNSCTGRRIRCAATGLDLPSATRLDYVPLRAVFHTLSSSSSFPRPHATGVIITLVCSHFARCCGCHNHSRLLSLCSLLRVS